MKAAPKSRPAVPAPPGRPLAPSQTILAGANPIAWNAALEREGVSLGGAPIWPAVRVLGPQGADSLFVFPARAQAPLLLGAWPREDPPTHAVHIFPRYRWILVETKVSGQDSVPRRERFFAANGSLLAEARYAESPVPIGRNLVLERVPSRNDSVPSRVSVVRLPDAIVATTWDAVTGWGAASPLENFLAVNTVGVQDPVTGIRQDELRLMDLEGTVKWVKSLSADRREFAVSNSGDVAIAREKALIVYDRYGSEKFRAPLPQNAVGRTAITPDGRFVLASARSVLPKPKGGDLWIGLFDLAHGGAVWSRRDLASGRGVDIYELALSDDGQRALVRLSTGPVLLLSRDGGTIGRWNLDRASRGESDPGIVPHRTWLSSDGTLVGLTSPVARSLAEAKGWLYRVPR